MGEVIGSERDVHGEGWRSRRLVLAEDRIGYSLYCLEGEGSVEDVVSGRRVQLRPGSKYSAGIGEPHVVRAETYVKVLCVFTPSLVGREEAD